MGLTNNKQQNIQSTTYLNEENTYIVKDLIENCENTFEKNTYIDEIQIKNAKQLLNKMNNKEYFVKELQWFENNKEITDTSYDTTMEKNLLKMIEGNKACIEYGLSKYKILDNNTNLCVKMFVDNVNDYKNIISA